MKDFIHERDKTVQNFADTKRLSSKNLSNLSMNFIKGLNESWPKFCPLCISKSEHNEFKG